MSTEHMPEGNGPEIPAPNPQVVSPPESSYSAAANSLDTEVKSLEIKPIAGGAPTFRELFDQKKAPPPGQTEADIDKQIADMIKSASDSGYLAVIHDSLSSTYEAIRTSARNGKLDPKEMVRLRKELVLSEDEDREFLEVLGLNESDQEAHLGILPYIQRRGLERIVSAAYDIRGGPKPPNLFNLNTPYIEGEWNLMEADSAIETKGLTEYEVALQAYNTVKERYYAIPTANRTQQQEDDLREARERVQDFIDEADRVRLLEDVRRSWIDTLAQLGGLKKGFDGLTTLRTRVPRYLPEFEQSFWSFSRHLNLHPRLGGIRASLSRLIFQGAEKELDGFRLEPNIDLADAEYKRFQDLRRRLRERETKVRYTEYLQVRFDWAETPEELEMVVKQWLRNVKVDEIPDEAAEDVYNGINQERHAGLTALKLAKEHLELGVGHPIYKKLKAQIEAELDLIGGERTLRRGGFPYFINSWNHFGNNFIDHWDAIYLKNWRVPIILDMLSANDGEYWRGAPNNVEKPSAGQMTRYQKDAEFRIAQFLKNNRLLLDYDKHFKKRDYGFGDEVEKILLNLEVFQKTKEDLDAKDGLAGLSKEEREQEIRTRIIQRITEKDDKYLTRIPQTGPERDKALWDWVMRHKGQSKWYPSGWDQVRLMIDRPEKIFDRAFKTDAQFEALVETIPDAERKLYQEMDVDELEEVLAKIKGVVEENPNKAVEELDRLGVEPMERLEDRIDKLEEIAFKAKELEEEIRDDIELAKRFQIFTGYASRVAGTRLRILQRTGEVAIPRITRIEETNGRKIPVLARNAKNKIIYDAVDENTLVPVVDNGVHQLSKNGLPLYKIPNSPDVYLEGKPIQKVVGIKPMYAEIRDRIAARWPPGTLPVRDKLVELGLVQGPLPVWHDYLVGDDNTIGAFAARLGHYFDNKEALIEMLEFEKRVFSDVVNEVAKEYMGTFITKDLNGEVVDFRKRLNTKGGNIDLRKLWFARMMFSTTGGVRAKKMDPDMDLGVFDFFWENGGAEDTRAFVNFFKRNNEVELQEEDPVFNVLDPIDFWKRMNGAERLRKLIQGGSFGNESFEGFLQFPLTGAAPVRDFLREKASILIDSIVNARSLGKAEKPEDLKKWWEGGIQKRLELLAVYKVTPDRSGRIAKDIRDQIAVAEAETISLGKLTGPDYALMPVELKDDAFGVAEKVLANFVALLKGRDYVDNRVPSVISEMGARKLYDATRLTYAFLRWIREEDEFRGIFGYALEAKSDWALQLYIDYLEDGIHLIMTPDDRRKFFPHEEGFSEEQWKNLFPEGEYPKNEYRRLWGAGATKRPSKLFS